MITVLAARTFGGKTYRDTSLTHLAQVGATLTVCGLGVHRQVPANTDTDDGPCVHCLSHGCERNRHV